jgi:hypothetical protein
MGKGVDGALALATATRRRGATDWVSRLMNPKNPQMMQICADFFVISALICVICG